MARPRKPKPVFTAKQTQNIVTELATLVVKKVAYIIKDKENIVGRGKLTDKHKKEHAEIVMRLSQVLAYSMKDKVSQDKPEKELKNE